MIDIENKLDIFLQERIIEKGAYDISQEGYDDIANDYEVTSFVVSGEGLQKDIMKSERQILLDPVCGEGYYVKISKIGDMLINGNVITPYNITNKYDLLAFLNKLNNLIHI